MKGVKVVVDYRGGADRGYVTLGHKWHKQLFDERSIGERGIIKSSPELCYYSCNFLFKSRLIFESWPVFKPMKLVLAFSHHARQRSNSREVR